MSGWVRLCAAADAPAEGGLKEASVGERVLCLARIDGELHALDNVCPHRQGPLSEGWVEGNAVVCPWHSWAFNAHTGIADPPDKGRVEVLPVKVEDGSVLVNIS